MQTGNHDVAPRLEAESSGGHGHKPAPLPRAWERVTVSKPEGRCRQDPSSEEGRKVGRKEAEEIWVWRGGTTPAVFLSQRRSAPILQKEVGSVSGENGGALSGDSGPAAVTWGRAAQGCPVAGGVLREPYRKQWGDSSQRR